MSALTDAPYQYNHIAGAATTVVRTGRAILNRVVVNAAGTTVTIFDNTAGSGPVVAIIGAITGSFTYEAECVTGITVVTVGAPADVTVLYKPL